MAAGLTRRAPPAPGLFRRVYLDLEPSTSEAASSPAHRTAACSLDQRSPGRKRGILLVAAAALAAPVLAHFASKEAIWHGGAPSQTSKFLRRTSQLSNIALWGE